MDARILVVDDDRACCELMREVLAQMTGAEVLAFTDSRAAAACLTKEKFGVILLDYRMPAPDGTALAKQARSAGLNQMTPIIMVSDDQSAAASAYGFAAGAQFFLYKPIDKARLAKLIRAMHGAVEHERRRFRRVPLNALVRLQIDNAEVEGQTIDVSLNGMLVQTKDKVPQLTPVRVALYGPKNNGLPITGSGSIVRLLAENCVGIHLNRLAPSESTRLQELLLPMIFREDEATASNEMAGANSSRT